VRPASGWWLVALGSFLFVGLAPLVVFGIVGVVNEVRLVSEGVITEGRVVGRREREVRYRIRVGKDEYTHADVTGRTSLWTSLDDDGLVEADGGVVSVRYLPDDPWVNRPVHAGAMPLGDPLAAACVFGSVGLGGIVLFVMGVRRVRRGRAAPAPSGF
jgi:hypothetical protein